MERSFYLLESPESSVEEPREGFPSALPSPGNLMVMQPIPSTSLWGNQGISYGWAVHTSASGGWAEGLGSVGGTCPPGQWQH